MTWIMEVQTRGRTPNVPEPHEKTRQGRTLACTMRIWVLWHGTGSSGGRQTRERVKMRCRIRACLRGENLKMTLLCLEQKKGTPSGVKLNVLQVHLYQMKGLREAGEKRKQGEPGGCCRVGACHRKMRRRDKEGHLLNWPGCMTRKCDGKRQRNGGRTTLNASAAWLSDICPRCLCFCASPRVSTRRGSRSFR